jgi:hypothetical protein
MSIQITDFPSEFLALGYIQARNAPRDTIRYGVRPNAIKCMAEYGRLLVALRGGDVEAGIPDMSGMATYHANAVAPVTPLVDLMQAAMHILIDTPALINQLALLQGETVAPMGEEITDQVDPTEYGALLLSMVAAVQTVGALMQGGGE